MEILVRGVRNLIRGNRYVLLCIKWKMIIRRGGNGSIMDIA